MFDAIRLVADAADFAARRHCGQKRKGASGAPYINHLIEVADLVAKTPAGRDPELVAAALLHDVVEDGHAAAAEIQARFGGNVAGLVEELTDDISLPDEVRKRRQVDEISGKSPAARLIKLADKVSNIREMAEDPPPGWPDEERRDYAEWARAVVDAGCRGLYPELERSFDDAIAKVLGG